MQFIGNLRRLMHNSLLNVQLILTQCLIFTINMICDLKRVVLLLNLLAIVLSIIIFVIILSNIILVPTTISSKILIKL